jgi:hypothetical protein
MNYGLISGMIWWIISTMIYGILSVIINGMIPCMISAMISAMISGIFSESRPWQLTLQTTPAQSIKGRSSSPLPTIFSSILENFVFMVKM